MITEKEIKNLLAVLASNNYKVGLEILRNITELDYNNLLNYADKMFNANYLQINNSMFHMAPQFSEISEFIETIININIHN